MLRALGLLLIVQCTLFGCRTTGVVLPKPEMKEMLSQDLINQIESRSEPITWLDGRASVTLQIEGKVEKFTSQIRIKTDSLFLANGKKISVEGGRLQISKDSFYLLNRLNKSIEIKAYNHVAEAYSVPLNFEELIQVILAKPIEKLEARNYRNSKRENVYSLKKNGERLETEYLVAPKTYDILAMNLADKISGQQCQIENSEFEEISGMRFPRLRTFIFDNGQGRTISLKVKFSKIELNVPKSFKFKVPPGYTFLD